MNYSKEREEKREEQRHCWTREEKIWNKHSARKCESHESRERREHELSRRGRPGPKRTASASARWAAACAAAAAASSAASAAAASSSESSSPQLWVALEGGLVELEGAETEFVSACTAHVGLQVRVGGLGEGDAGKEGSILHYWRWARFLSSGVESLKHTCACFSITACNMESRFASVVCR